MTKLIFKIIGMHCTSCSLLIDTALEELPGVKSAQTSYANSSSIIKFDETKVNQEKIIEVIKKEGYETKISV